MKAAILQCDEVLAKFQPEFGQYQDMIRHMLDSVDKDITCDCFDCRQGHYPEDIHHYDFYITTGSKSSVYETESWIHQLIEFVRQLDRERKKLIGICFGHQIIAMAYHGVVEKSDKGWGVGVASNQVIKFPDWMDEPIEKLNILVSHQDQITVLPEGADVIAKSNFCPYFLVQWNDFFLSIQGHPEWNRDYSRTLMNERRQLIGNTLIESGLDSLTTIPDNQLFTRWIINFVDHQAF